MEFINLSSTASTLLITLYSRANMSKKGLIIKDPKAEEIIQLAGYSQKKLKANFSHQVFLSIRAKLMDDYTLDFLRKHDGNCTVIQIACGLDSRYLRMNDDRVKWYDLDLYGTIELRKKYYKNTKNYKMIESNVCNFTWVEKVDPEDLKKPTLIIAEGLFMYLSKEDNEHVFSSLPKHFKDVDIIFDAFSPLVKAVSKHVPTLRRTHAYFSFGFKDPKIIENMSDKIKHKQTISYQRNKYVKELPWNYRVFYWFKKIFADKMSRIEIYHIEK